EDLVVQAWTDSLAASVEERGPRLLDLGRSDEIAPQRPDEDVGALPVAGVGHAVPLGRGQAGVADPVHLALRPDVELALHALGVSVLGRVEGAVLGGQVAPDVGDGL